MNEFSRNFDAFFEYATMGIIVMSKNGEIITINPFTLKVFGYELEELIGKKIEILIPQRFQQKYKQYRNEYNVDLPCEPIVHKIELFGLKKDGQEIPIEVSLAPYSGNDNKQVIIFISDISVRNKAKIEIQKMNNELELTINKRTKDLQIAMLKLEQSKIELKNTLVFQKTLLDTAGVMIIATDENGIIDLFNPEAATLLGYSQNEILGKETPVLFHSKEDIIRKRKQLAIELGVEIENDFDVLVELVKRNIREEEQYLYFKKNGDSFPVSLTITTLRNSDGSIAGFMAIGVDITERVKAEKNLKKKEHLFLQLLENYPDGIISIIDKDFHFVYTGGELHKQLQADVRKLIGKSVFPYFPEALRKFMLPILERVFKEKVYITDFELPYPVLNNTYIMDAFPLMREDGVVNYLGVIIKNISELKLIEKGLRADLKIEKDLNELKSIFVSMASHEFRTPLSTVLSSAWLIEKYTSAEDQPKREKHIQRIISSVNMLTDILEDFLSLGKIEEGKLEAKISEFDLQKAISTTINEIKNNLKKDQQIKYEHEGDSKATLDPSLLKHILLNLVSNASKFSSDHAVIEIKTRQINNHLSISVKDDGIGISREDQKHLMDRFFRAENAQNIQGTGLGLHIVSKYAEMLNGKLKFKSELGKGSEFWIEFKSL